jgi:hypothetical protein
MHTWTTGTEGDRLIGIEGLKDGRASGDRDGGAVARLPPRGAVLQADRTNQESGGWRRCECRGMC